MLRAQCSRPVSIREWFVLKAVDGRAYPTASHLQPTFQVAEAAVWSLVSAVSPQGNDAAARYGRTAA
jgi:hypothetical protein